MAKTKGRPKKELAEEKVIEEAQPQQPLTDGQKLDALLGAVTGLTGAITQLVQGGIAQPQTAAQSPPQAKNRVTPTKRPLKPQPGKNGKINKFELMPEFEAFADEIDTRGWTPTERKAAPVNPERSCQQCGAKFFMPASAILGKDQRILCNSCIGH